MVSYLAYSFKTSNKESPSTFQFICISGSSTILANSFSFSLGEHSSTNEVFVSLQSRCWRQPQTSLATLISENIVIKFFCTTILQKLIAILDSKILRDSDIRPVFQGSIVYAFLQSVTIKVKNEDQHQCQNKFWRVLAPFAQCFENLLEAVIKVQFSITTFKMIILLTLESMC